MQRVGVNDRSRYHTGHSPTWGHARFDDDIGQLERHGRRASDWRLHCAERDDFGLHRCHWRDSRIDFGSQQGPATATSPSATSPSAASTPPPRGTGGVVIVPSSRILDLRQPEERAGHPPVFGGRILKHRDGLALRGHFHAEGLFDPLGVVAVGAVEAPHFRVGGFGLRRRVDVTTDDIRPLQLFR